MRILPLAQHPGRGWAKYRDFLMMDSNAEPRREVQIALEIVKKHPHASGEELDALVKEALQLRTTPMARIWRILAQGIQAEQQKKQETAEQSWHRND